MQNNPKRARLRMLIQTKQTDFKTKTISGDKERHFITIKWNFFFL